MKSLFCFCLALLIVCFPFSTGVAQTKLINPGIPNSFIEDYILPDGTIRFIGSENGRNRELFFVDRLTDGSITEPVFFPESIGGLEFNFAGIDCKVLPLNNGDVILGINQGDCDYAPPSSLARFSPEGEPIWAVSMEYFDFYYFVHKLILVDSNVVCIISDEADSLYFDTNGNEVVANHTFIVYDTVVHAQSGYYSSLGNILFRLNESFDGIDSVFLGDEIHNISPSGDSLILVSTPSSLTLLDAYMDIIAHSTDYININMVATSTNSVWLGDKSGNIIQLDYALQGLDTFKSNKDIHLKALVAVNNEIILGGNYKSSIGTSVFFHEAEADDFEFGFMKDITLESVMVEQPVFYSFEPNAYPFGFNIFYRDPVVNIANTGFDTIQSITIRYKEGSTCLLCESENHEWSFDSLDLYPGLKMEFALEDFTALCVGRAPSMFCLSILPVDSLPEIDRVNNRLCIEVNALMTRVIDFKIPDWELNPNPANNFIAIQLKNNISSGDHQIMIFDMYGCQKINQPIEGSSQMIDIHHLESGIYYVLITDPLGVAGVSKLVVINTL